LTEPVGERRELTWDKLWGALGDLREYRGDAHPGWSAATFRENRRGLENVEQVFALCLDFDHGVTIDEALARMAQLELGGFLHTTRKHTPTAPRFRIVIPLSRPVSPFEYGILWRNVAPDFGSVDEAPKDPSRFWFLPGTENPSAFVARRVVGAFLGVDQVLARPEPKTKTSRSQERPTGDVAERARRYIAQMDPAISGSAGHKATFRVACVLVRGFDLDDGTALSILEQDYNPRCEPPWKPKELAHKVTSARRMGRLDFGEILERGDAWRPQWDEPAPRRAPVADQAEVESDIERDAIQAEANPAQTDDAPKDRWRVVWLRDSWSQVLDEMGAGKEKTGCTTGHHELDTATGGIRPEHVWAFGAATSFGKSSWAIMVSDDNSTTGNRALIVGCEDSPGMYTRRIIARRTAINALRLRDNSCGPDEIQRAANELALLQDRPFVLPAIGMTAEKIAQAIRDLVPSLGIKVVLVDYIQRIRSQKETQDRRNEVTRTAEVISDAIKLSGAGGVLFSQIKRVADGREPTMHDLKESGDIENMAEHVVIGWREETGTDNERRWIKLEKNKDGPAGGRIEMPWDRKTASFRTVKDPEQERLERESEYYDRRAGIDEGFFDN
jgi:hypothetical protein